MIFSKAQPFVKWAGGKRKVIGKLRPFLPDMKDIIRYKEPFVGSGAMFFHLISMYDFEDVILNDANKDLMLTYECIKRFSYEVLEGLEEASRIYNKEMDDKGREALFYEVRDRFNEQEVIYRNPHHTLEFVGRAVDFIFLNKTTFNALYRENKDGKFNSPWGRKKEVSFYSRDNIIKCGEALNKNVTIRMNDYTDEFSTVGWSRKGQGKGTFVYLDPPYLGTFDGYQPDKFSYDSHKHLCSTFRRLARMGSRVMMSNSPNRPFFEKYLPKGIIHSIFTQRTIAADPESRGLTEEFVITSY